MENHGRTIVLLYKVTFRWGRGLFCFIILQISLTGKGLCSPPNAHHPNPGLFFVTFQSLQLRSFSFLGKESRFLKRVEADVETQNQRT